MPVSAFAELGYCILNRLERMAVDPDPEPEPMAVAVAAGVPVVNIL
ncbi:hypothetical protein [Acidithiobacillus caldus]|nr:hypothetical protein [Acidithiobacillus caldus]